MKFACDKCSSRYLVDDKKVVGKTVHVRCKRCGNVIKVRGPKPRAPGAGRESLAPAPTTGAQSRIAEPSRSGSVPGAAAARATSVDWHYSVGGRSFGPFNEDDLIAKFLSGQLGDDTYVWNAGMVDWRPAYDLPEFAPALDQAHLRHPQAGALGLASSPQARPAAKPAQTVDLSLLDRSPGAAELPEGGFAARRRVPTGDRVAARRPADVAPSGEALERLRSLRERLLSGSHTAVEAPTDRPAAPEVAEPPEVAETEPAPREPDLAELRPAAETFAAEGDALALDTSDFEALRVAEKESTYSYEAVTTVEPPPPETLEELKRAATARVDEPALEPEPVAAGAAKLEVTEPVETVPGETAEAAETHEPGVSAAIEPDAPELEPAAEEAVPPDAVPEPEFRVSEAEVYGAVGAEVPDAEALEAAFFSDDVAPHGRDDFSDLEAPAPVKQPTVDTQALAAIRRVQKRGQGKRWAGIGLLAAVALLGALFLPSFLESGQGDGQPIDSLEAFGPRNRPEAPLAPAPAIDADLSTLNLTAAVNLSMSEVHRAAVRGIRQSDEAREQMVAAASVDAEEAGTEPDDGDQPDEPDREERSESRLRVASLRADDEEAAARRVEASEGSGGPSIFTRLSGRTVNIEREPTELELEAQAPREHSTRLSADYFDEDLEQVRRAVQRCHELQLRESSGVQFARVVLDFSVEPDGSVAIDMDDQLATSTFGRCLQTRYTTWTFRSFEGETVTLQRTYALQ